MYNPQETSIAIKGYLKKLKKILSNETIFNLGKTRIVNKSKIDDILCCVEGSLPEEYKNYVKKYGITRLKSYSCLNQLHAAIKNKFLFSTSKYAVNMNLAEFNINGIMSAIDADLDKVLKDV